MTEAQKLKQQLLEILAQENINHDEILSLSSKLAELDTDYVRFSVDASLISRLGLELVAKQETALAELVKNGYDADARKVELTFRDHQTPGGLLTVIDDGVGMTKQELIQGFMRLSTPEKKSNPYSKRFKRRRAGKKGIGRFSAQRLGRKLTIITQTEDSPNALHVTIDWDKFDTNQDISSISSRIQEREKVRPAGTTLLINALRDGWTDSQMKRCYRYISDLFQPFPLSNVSANIHDPGFKSTFYRIDNNSNKPIPVVDEEEVFYRHALAVIDATVDGDGKISWSLSCERFSVDIKNISLEDNPWSNSSGSFILKNVSLRAYYYITNAGLIQKTYERTIQQVLRDKGGIRLYRNGFRVAPYGDQGNDWLKLDLSTRGRWILPPHANNNFLGFVEIHDQEEISFEETSSREGLIENEAFLQLKTLVYQVLRGAVLRIAALRGKKEKASDPPKKHKPSESASGIAERVRFLGGQEGTSTAHEANWLADQIETIGSQGDQLIEEIGMLRVLASLGLSIAEFTHEVRHSMGSLEAGLSLLRGHPDVANDPTLSEFCSDMHSSFLSMQSYARYFDSAVADNTHRKLQPIELRDVVNNFTNIVRPKLVRNNIALDIDITGYDLFSRPMHNSEWTSILLNFLTNSIKAIKNTNRSGQVLIRAGKDDKNVFIEFVDNGTGIPDEVGNRVFEAFYTTSRPPAGNSPDIDELTGSGLGLKIVKDIVVSAMGEVYLTSPPPGYTTCFRVEIPKASDEEIPEDAY